MLGQIIRPPLVKGVFGLALAILAVGGMCSTSSIAGEYELRALLAKDAAILARMHKKAKKALVNAAQDKAFTEYFSAGDLRHRHTAKHKIENVTLNVQRNFHVEEMCLITPDGAEITRVVGNTIAPDHELSLDERNASFFAPGFSLAPKRVYVSRPYLSMDAHKWVVAYVTPVTLEGHKKALLHYEHDLDVYQRRLNKGLQGNDRFVLLVTEDGYIISDSRKPLTLVKQGNKLAPEDYFVTLGSVGDGNFARLLSESGDRMDGFAILSDRGHRYGVAFRRIEDGYTLMAFEKHKAAKDTLPMQSGAAATGLQR